VPITVIVPLSPCVAPLARPGTGSVPGARRTGMPDGAASRRRSGSSVRQCMAR